MKYNKTIKLKDSRTCVIRNGTEQDAEAVLSNFIKTHGETDFLTTYPEETSITLEQERAYLTKRTESDREVELVAEVDGVIAGTAGVDLMRSAEKTRHRAKFGISIERAWWGLGIGRSPASSVPKRRVISRWSWMLSQTTHARWRFIGASALSSTAAIPRRSAPGSAAGKRMSSCGWSSTLDPAINGGESHGKHF